MKRVKVKDDSKRIPALEFHPLNNRRWSDFEQLFGPRGACGGCWCMFRRLKRAEFEKQKGEGNKKAMKAIVDSENVPGLLAYSLGEPIGWCSVGPREHYSGLERSRILRPIDDRSVWSVVCFFVKREYRNKGLTVKFLHAAIDYVRQNGGKLVEAYPIQPKKETVPSVFAWPGLVSAFKQANFIECIRRSETRPIMRYHIEEAMNEDTTK